MTNTTTVAHQLLIENAETLKALAQPLRLEILRLLAEPKTVKDIGLEMDLPPTKLYYHVNTLESHGLIQVVDTQIVSGIIEKSYQVTARHYQIGEALLAGNNPEENLQGLLSTLFDLTRAELTRAVRHRLISLEDDRTHQPGALRRASLRLTTDQFARISAQLTAVLDELETMITANEQGPTDELRPYGLLLALYPIATGDHQPEEHT